MPRISARQVLTPTGWLTDGVIDTADGRISALSSSHGPADHAFLVPGFIDLQVNGFDTIDLAVAPAESWATVSSSLAAHGVTAWLPTLVSRPLDLYPPWLDSLATLAANRAPADPRILGAHLEGPWLGDRVGAHRDVAAGPIDLRWIDELPATVKVVTLGPERQGANEAIARLAARGIVVALGHTDASHQVATDAFDAGATMLTHCFNATPALHHRAPGVIGAALSRDDVVVSLIADGIHVHPDVLRIAFRAKGAGRVLLISDASGWASGSLGAQKVELIDGAPRTAEGTLAGSALTLDDAVRYVVEHCAVPLEEAIGAATSVPARILRRDDIGCLAPNANADVVALDDNLGVRAVWIGGVEVS